MVRITPNENNKRSMRTEIIEILQKAYPEYCLKHIDIANDILRLFNVSNNEVAVCRHEYYHVEELPIIVCTNCGEILGRQTDC